jgi:outer membrane protein OmpA-like peptidoglycan-associated protein
MRARNANARLGELASTFTENTPMSCIRAPRIATAILFLAGALAPRAAWAQDVGSPPPPPVDGQPKPADTSAPPPSPVAPPAAPVAKGTAADAAPVAPSDSAGAAADEEVDWKRRDVEIAEQSTLTGGAGLLRTEHAQTNAPGQFRLSFIGEWFSAGFLCTSKFPCPDPNGGVPITSDTMNHVGGTLALGVSIAKLGPGVIDASAALITYANSDSANRPALLQVLGDSVLGVRYVAPVGDVFHLGATINLWLINGSGSVGLDGNATSARFMGMATADLREMKDPVPLRFSANVAYSLDNTGDVLNSTEAARMQPVTRIERYGLGVNRVDHVDFLLGAEAILDDGLVRPFLESRIIAANNRQGYVCPTANVGNDKCLKNDTVVPAVLTLGGRFFPWKREFSVLAALDIGLSGTNDFIEEVQPVPPWTLYLGLGWTAETLERTVEKVVAPPLPVVPRTVHVSGFVHEKDKNDAIADAILAYKDHTDLSRLATGPEGRFGDDVLPGSYSYDVKADGFKPGTCDFTTKLPVPAAPIASVSAAPAKAPPSPPLPTSVDVDCVLEALPRVGAVIGHVRDADTNQPLAGTPIMLSDSQHKELRLASDASGTVRFDGVSPGTATLTVVADGYLALVTPEDVKPRQENTVDLILLKKPARSQVQVTAKEITIRDQIQFALDSAVILPQSFGILTEVADTLIRHGELTRVEVQGHTDSSGTPDHNKSLSEDRAEAVRAWLVAHGVPTDRLVAHGYGQTRPLAPNATAANRSQNRRVQFIIVEKDGVPLSSKGASPLP